MTGIILLILVIGLTISYHVGLIQIFKKHDKPFWAALVPVYRIKIWTEIVGRPKWYVYTFAAQFLFVAILLLTGGVNIFPWWVFVPFYLVCVYNVFLFANLCIDLAKSYGKDRFIDNAIAVLFPGVMMPMIGFNKEIEYKGPAATFPKEKKGFMREWADAIGFAVFAASIIRWATFEAFTIPTPSMESSLLVGDYLFVSKMHYGTRTPMTLLQVPLTHRFLWFTGNENGTDGVDSYSDAVQLPYLRLPGIKNGVEREDIVVFNYPGLAKGEFYEPNIPVDLKTNYVKRCVAIPGDELKIKDGEISVNGTKLDMPYAQFNTILRTKSKYGVDQFKELGVKIYGSNNIEVNLFNVNSSGGKYVQPNIDNFIKEKFSIKEGNKSYLKNHYYQLTLSEDLIQKIKEEFGSDILGTARICSSSKEANKGQAQGNPMFCYRFHAELAQKLDWTQDNISGFTVPKKGWTIELTDINKAIYWHTICFLEGNKNVVMRDGSKDIEIDGKKITSYTFKKDYYFMMGDNRHNSLDSRFWGFVPEDHIVGTPVMIWFSKGEEGIRWSRMFNFI